MGCLGISRTFESAIVLESYSSEGAVRRVFQEADTDNSGMITLEEMAVNGR